MKILSGAALACFFLFAGLVISTPLLAQTTIIENVTVIDAALGRREHMRVLIENDKITSVSTAEGEPPDALRLVDGAGKYLIPGLSSLCRSPSGSKTRQRHA